MLKKNMISVVLPVYNGESHIVKTIDSLLAQTYKNIEIIVVNDGSTDRTLEVLSTIGDERVNVFTLKQNSGISQALNFSLSVASGEYIARADADDFSEPDRLEKQIKFLMENPTYGLCGTYQKIVGGYRDGLNKTAETEREIRSGLIFGPTVLHSTVMLRRSVIQSFMPEVYRTDRYLCEDYDLWVRLSKISKCYTIPDFLCYYFWDAPKNWESSNNKLLDGLKNIWADALSDLLIYRPGNFTITAHQILVDRAEISITSLPKLLLHSMSLMIHILFKSKDYSVSYAAKFIFRRGLSCGFRLLLDSWIYKTYKKLKKK